MRFWDNGVVVTAVILGALLLVAAAVRRRWPGIPIPDCILAGFGGLLLGPGGLDLLPLDGATLESIVYHGLAISFVALGLRRSPGGGSKGVGVRAVMFLIPILAVVQGLLGLGIVLSMTHEGGPMHPGVGLMLPLGFSQGPGVALSMGRAWEDVADLTSGGQLGLFVAALGFAWAIGGGIAMVFMGRRKGLLSSGGVADGPPPNVASATWSPIPGGVGPLGVQLGLMCLVYCLTFASLEGLDVLFAENKTARATVWGFHFTIAALLALGGRAALRRTSAEAAFDDDLLGRLGRIAIDVTTLASIAAIRIDAVAGWMLPVLVVTVAGGLTMFLLIPWICRRVFADHHREHAIALYGMCTGTLPTGLALLRMVDPRLESPVADHLVIGASTAVGLSLPLLGVLAMPVAGWPDTHPGNALTAMAIIGGYAVVLLVIWWRLGGFRPGAAKSDA